MIDRIPDLPDNVLGFTASGTITGADYENVIVPAVEALFAAQGKVRFLYHLGDAFDGFDAAAAWDDTKLGLRHLSGWERMALVSDVEWIRGAVKVFGVVISGHVRVFHNSELDEAKHWIAE